MKTGRMREDPGDEQSSASGFSELYLVWDKHIWLQRAVKSRHTELGKELRILGTL